MENLVILKLNIDKLLLENNLLFVIFFISFIPLLIFLFKLWYSQKVKEIRSNSECRKTVCNVFSDLSLSESYTDVSKKFSALGLELSLVSEENQNGKVYKCYKVPLWWKYNEKFIETTNKGVYHSTYNMTDSISLGRVDVDLKSNSNVLCDASISLMFENNLLVSKGQQGLL